MAEESTQIKMCPKHKNHKLDNEGRCPSCMLESVLAEAAEEAKEELEKAVESYEKLVCACDGGEDELTMFDATTFMAMLDDHRYRAKVRKAHQKTYG